MKIKIKLVVTLMLTGMLLTACHKEMTVSYYKTHEKEREAMLQMCHEDPGGMRGNPDCVNAESAQLFAGSATSGRIPISQAAIDRI